MLEKVKIHFVIINSHEVTKLKTVYSLCEGFSLFIFEKNITYGNIQSKRISDTVYNDFISKCIEIQSDRMIHLKEQGLTLKKRRRYIKRLGKVENNFMAYLTDEEMATLVKIIRNSD